jgi:DNA repair protein RecN (Recombination protein N)
MLEELRIRNFAIIDNLTLDFNGGFNVITGETGAGKSILIDAVELLLGSKADDTLVRAGAGKAIVEGVFVLDDRAQARVLPILEREELIDSPDEAAYITLSREIRRNGRSSSRLNGLTCSMDILNEVGSMLVDIHGQSAHLSLLKPRAHMDLLDRYADLLEVRSALAKVVDTLADIRRRIKTLQEDKDDLERRADRLRYEVKEIEAARLDPDEEGELTEELNRLANSEKLALLSSQANAILSGDDTDEILPALDAIQQVATLLNKLADIDPQMNEDAQLADELSTNAQELSINLASYIEEIEHDPDRLNELEERLEFIKQLKRRYRVDTVAEVMAYGEEAREELDSIEHSDRHLTELRDREEQTLRHIGDLAERISTARQKAGEHLAKKVVRELKDLRMENTRFEVVLERTDDPENGCYGKDDTRYQFDSTGIDRVEFMMSANPGEPLRPLAKVASGGEAARIMLSLKRVLSQADDTPTLIFDEIDQGIGGRIGAVVGEKLWSLSGAHQVLCVTHLPQLASFGDLHFHVSKQIEGKRTRADVIELDSVPNRINELAAMLGATGESGQQSARDILNAAHTRKSELRPAPPMQENFL